MTDPSKIEGLRVKLTGLGPLSYEVTEGAILSVRAFAPSAKSRPSVGGRFKGTAYIVFSGVTKVGRLSPAALKKVGDPPPNQCQAVRVDKDSKILEVEFT